MNTPEIDRIRQEEINRRRAADDACKHAEQRSVEREEATMDAIKVEIDPTAALPQVVVGRDEDGPVYGEMSLIEGIIDAAARMAIRGDDDLKKKIDERVSERIDLALDEELPDLLRHTFTDPIMVTDPWGAVKEKGITVADLIVKRAREQLTVDERELHTSRHETVLSKVTRQLIDSRLEAELNKAIKAARVQLLERVAKVAGAQIADAVAEQVDEAAKA